jgi:hypothetical protein
MTTTERATIDASLPDNIADYFVVAIKSGDDNVQSIMYYETDRDSDQWKKVSAKNLNAKGRVGGYIRLSQPDIKEVILRTELSYDKLDETVQLFAGVAKTLFGEDKKHDNLFGLENGAMLIPVTKNTVRGLILIFSKVGVGGSLAGKVMQLIASPDPEIKNSTGGT